ncbi:hypothetical protein ACFV1W_20915 [Kitasatospora sp. NPDC059648]|uniref:hypothetical protein n=1 Tax=Kitasatospora sp. NPDC059648 TaxID=3346894 RepID=UPI0036BBE2EC
MRDVYRGTRPDLHYAARRCAGSLLLPLPRAGTVRRITPPEELVRVPWVVEAVLKIGVGDSVAARRASDNASGYVRVVGDSIEEVERRLREVLGMFTVELGAPPAGPSAAAPPGTTPAPPHRSLIQRQETTACDASTPCSPSSPYC